MKKFITLLFLLNLIITDASAVVVGDWTLYPSFTNLTEAVEAGNKVYFLASGSLYSVNRNDESVEVYDKSKTLNDYGIRHIAWCQSAKRLLIVYTNHNIDLLEENTNTINISDYRTKVMTGDKTVNSINVYNEFAYVSTGFGILKINMKKAEISDSYNLGFSVEWTHLDDKYIYAESESKGCYRALLTSNLQDKHNWERTDNYTSNSQTVSDELKAMAQTYKPDGPKSNYHIHLNIAHNRIYSMMGQQGEGRTPPSYIQIKTDNGWTTLGGDVSYLTKRRFFGVNDLVVDRNDPDHVYMALLSGLFEFKDGKAVKEYYYNNCPLEYNYELGPTHTNYSTVSTMAMDKEGNIWCFNTGAEHPGIIKFSKDGEWTRFSHSEFTQESKIQSLGQADDMFVDSRGIIWFVNSHHLTPGLMRYDIATDKAKAFTHAINQDGATIASMLGFAVAEDKEGNIWFGTEQGLMMLPADRVMTDEDVLYQVKVPRNDGTNLADYLLNSVHIRCIAVDGGNRKWIGTQGMGIYVISSDNMEQVHHFTTQNSPLVSNDVSDIAIDHATGEVYIATDLGLCSYTMDATEGAETLDSNEVYAYPNPVTPDYDGPITISGLTYNSYIKIVSVSGQLVAEGRSNGGTFVWDGTNLDGKRVASGVYMVLAATEDGKSGAVCKVAVVR